MADAKDSKKNIKAKKPGLIVEAVAEDNVPTVVVEKEVLEAPEVEEAPKVIAKAGKRSTKAIKEIEEKQAKASRKAAQSSEALAKEEGPKPTKNRTRTKAERAGKKYREAAKLIERDKLYSLAQALELVAKTSTTKFDATVEMHINLGVDPRQADQNVRDTVALPAGTGKKIRVAVFADADDAEKAKAAGADLSGADQIAQLLDKETIEFDTLIATPSMMPKLGKYARLLGPRGLMPNPKSGTVTADVATAVKEAKAGRVEYRVDQAGIIHLGIGKISFGPAKLLENAEAVMSSVRAARPASLKTNYIKTTTVTSSMGPGVKVEI